MTSRRVVVTGVGILSCLGDDPDLFFDRLTSGVSGISMHPEIERHPVGWVSFSPEEHFTRTELLGLDRVSQFAVVASRQAVKHAQLPLDNGESIGVLFGTGLSGATTLETTYGNFFGARKERLLSIPMAMPNAPASQIAISIGAMGECQTYSTACSCIQRGDWRGLSAHQGWLLGRCRHGGS